jgi:hypothetical protein
MLQTIQLLLTNLHEEDRKLPKQGVTSIWWLKLEKMIHCIVCTIGHDRSRVKLEAIR